MGDNGKKATITARAELMMTPEEKAHWLSELGKMKPPIKLSPFVRMLMNEELGYPPSQEGETE